MGRNISLGGKIQVGAAVANVDAKYGPYNSKNAAYNALGEGGMDVIAEGLTIGIIENGRIVEYWWQGGTSLSNLVKKGGGSESLNSASISYDNSVSGMSASNVKDAIDELHGLLNEVNDVIEEVV